MEQIDPKNFAAWYVSCGNAHDAAVFCGAKKNAGLIGLKMMTDRTVRRRIAELRSKSVNPDPISGLRRIAFGRNNDAVRLAASAAMPAEEGAAVGASEILRSIGEMDLFGVSEIKYGKNGVEIKFFDRLKALETLKNEQTHEREADSAAAIIGAIYGEGDTT